ncbi:MAG TPA: ATP-binding protein [Candidatus Obscuribacterales bacterium]
MAQPNPASQPIDNQLKRSPEQELEVNSKRSPAQEIDHIRNSDIYCPVQRDEALFKWFNTQRDARCSGYIKALNGADLRKACQFYRMKEAKRRGVLQAIPMPVAYAEVKQYGAPTDLFLSILAALGHPLAGVGPLKDLRSRTWGTLKAFSVKLLIVGNAHYLPYKSFNELVEIVRSLKVAVIPAGSLYLDEILNRPSKRYTDIYNTFLDSHEFVAFSKKETVQLVASWEEQVLVPLERQLNLASMSGLCDSLYTRCNGQAEPLYECLRQIAIYMLENSDTQLNSSSLDVILATRRPPINASVLRA